MSKQILPTLRRMRPSATLAINERSKALEASGKHIFRLGLGQSPFPVPASVTEALRKHAAEKDYLAVQGLAALRDVVAHWHNQRTQQSYGPDNVIIGPGSKELLFLLQLVSTRRLTLPSPSWVSYGPQAQILGRDVDWIDTSFETRWSITAEALEELCLKTPSIPRLLLLNYPSNPTGLTLPRTELKAIAEVARKHNVLIISDEIYGALTFEEAHTSIADYYPEGTIITSGLSKWCGAGGWRLGYAVIPNQQRATMKALKTVASETFTSVSAPIQCASVRAFERSTAIDRYLADCNRLLSGLADAITSRLALCGARVHRPEGGFYIFPDFSPGRLQLNARGVHTSAEMAERILDETGVAFLPGSCFGRPSSEFTARISFVDFDGAHALAALGKIPLDTVLTPANIETLCAPTIKAISLIADWFGPCHD